MASNKQEGRRRQTWCCCKVFLVSRNSRRQWCGGAAISFFRAKAGKIDKINKCWYKGAVETLTFVSGLVVVRITNVMVEVHVTSFIFYTLSLSSFFF